MRALVKALQSAPTSLFVLGADGRITEANAAALAQVGREASDVIGQAIGELGVPLAALGEAATEAWRTQAPVRVGGGTALPLGNGRILVTTGPEDTSPSDAQVARTQSLLAAIVESSDDAIVSKSLDGIITSWNAGAERILGYTADEAVGQSVLMLIPPERRDEERMILDRIRRGQRVDHFETVRVDRSGRKLDVAITVSPIRDAEGRVVGASKVLRDVTAQREIETALRASEERARLALDAARLGLWSWDPATDAGTQDARTKEILGLGPDEALTMAEGFARVIHPDDLPAVQAAVSAAIDPAGEGLLDIESRIQADETRWIRATARTTFVGEGPARRPVQMVGTLGDVTSQRATERQLLAVIDGLPELAWSARPDGHIDFYNGRWYDYTGTTLEEMEGWGWEAVHDPAVLPEVVAEWERSLATGEPFEMEFPLRRADGAFRWFLTRATPVRDADGRVTRWIGVNTDVHDRRRAETQARFLAEAGRLAEEALDFDATLDRLATLAVPGFSDWCSISLRQDDGSIEAVAIAHADPEKVRWGWDLQAVQPVNPDDPTGVPNVIRTGQSELYPDVPDELLVASVADEEELALLREIGFSSVIIVPIRADDDVIGAVSFVNTESGRHFDEQDLATAEEIGRRAGSALETARLYRALQGSEATAREAESRTRALFDATPDVVLVYPVGDDGPEPFIEVNEAAVETYGYARDELLQMRVGDLLAPGVIALPDAVERLRREGRGRFESAHRTRDGRVIPMETVAHLVRRDGQEMVLSVCRDVTERREAERALRERERELQTLANSIPQMAWMADTEGRILWFNRRWYDYTGARPDGAPPPDMRDLLHPDEADRVAEGYRAAFASGQPWEDTFRLRGASGEYRWFLSRALPIQGPDRQAARWFGTNTDVTEQRALLTERDEALDRLRQSQERHRLALEGGEMGTWEWHIPEDHLEGDERVYRLWGMRPGEVESVAAFYGRLVHPDDLPGLQAEVARALTEEDTYAAEFRIVRPDGHVRWVANRGRVVRDADGAPVRMFGLSYDVTERRESEETLRQKNAEMEQFAYTISHDLKSPLVTITGFLGVLKGQVQAGQAERALASAERVLGAADRMGRLIEDLLHLSRAGRVLGDPVPVDLDALVGGLAEAFGRRVQEAGGALDVVGPLGRLLADERRVGEVVENLLANAVRYGLGGGGTRIVVRSEPARGGGLRLVVEDDGPGVPESYRRKVFELFQRLDGGGEGTGIGLALVARILEVMGGRAFVESAGGPPGREGARFVLQFPASAVLDRPAATEPSPARTTGGPAHPQP
ncbi:PAS domain S-box protein [Rubrivirga marina]|uniref:histidine kinase n=1 Tax=Rubrivirga marina TaxID=1196024 RepID=A0A271IZH9_9BACT|nr:PAS domain S-box protein [Rubrivirga marina]PAP75899.1 hypothetical protein BSZ37_05320 [Rubrivirga marina]